MKIPHGFNTATEIANFIAENYGIPKDGVIEMKNDKSNLFRLYLHFEGTRIVDFNIEQFNGDEGSYMYLPDPELVSNKHQTLGKVIDFDLKPAEDPNFSRSDSHVWMRVHRNSYDEFITLLSLHIQRSAEIHKANIYKYVQMLMSHVNEYLNIARQVKL